MRFNLSPCKNIILVLVLTNIKSNILPNSTWFNFARSKTKQQRSKAKYKIFTTTNTIIFIRTIIKRQIFIKTCVFNTLEIKLFDFF